VDENEAITITPNQNRRLLSNVKDTLRSLLAGFRFKRCAALPVRYADVRDRSFSRHHGLSSTNPCGGLGVPGPQEAAWRFISRSLLRLIFSPPNVRDKGRRWLVRELPVNRGRTEIFLLSSGSTGAVGRHNSTSNNVAFGSLRARAAHTPLKRKGKSHASSINSAGPVADSPPPGG
jgi:hypothetical protein